MLLRYKALIIYLKDDGGVCILTEILPLHDGIELCGIAVLDHQESHLVGKQTDTQDLDYSLPSLLGNV